MFKFLAKSAIASLIWSKYRRIILSTLALFCLFFVISFVHDDFLEYARVSGTSSGIATAYLLKWGLLAAITGIYYYLNIHPRANGNSNNNTNNKTQNQSKPPPEQKASSLETSAHDPFKNIRKKQRLHSKADRILKD